MNITLDSLLLLLLSSLLLFISLLLSLPCPLCYDALVYLSFPKIFIFKYLCVCFQVIVFRPNFEWKNGEAILYPKYSTSTLMMIYFLYDELVFSSLACALNISSLAQICQFCAFY